MTDPALPDAVRRVQQVIGPGHAVRSFDADTRTSAQAAEAIGCTVAQIAKSIVFRARESDRVVLVVLSGAQRVDERRLAEVLGERVARADARFVRERTGYVIGGVPPVAHREPPVVFVDPGLRAFDSIWAAAGTPNTVFETRFDALVAMSGATVVEVAEGDRPAVAATTAIAPITDMNPTVEAMQARVARFATLRPTDAYVDAGIPGCERTTYAVLGHGPQAALPAEDFHLNLVRCAPGKAAPLHNHLTQEVFIALSGTWEVFWGPEGARSLRLGPWDTISIPPGVSRGFRNAGTDDAWLIGIAGGRDPGMINWPASVRAAAAAAGVTLPAG